MGDVFFVGGAAFTTILQPVNMDISKKYGGNNNDNQIETTTKLFKKKHEACDGCDIATKHATRTYAVVKIDDACKSGH